MLRNCILAVLTIQSVALIHLRIGSSFRVWEAEFRVYCYNQLVRNR